MADYIYLLENRLTGAQQSALAAVREIARARGLTVFLVGGAVRDLTSGSPVRDLDVAVQGNALKLRKDIEKSGAQISGEHDLMQSLYLRYPGSVRMELSSTVDVTYPKPGKPSVRAATIQEDLRRRDFTANAMAISLNEGSYGLLMDPLNGVADIENRELRLVSNYGFIEDPVRMIRAVRLGARLGWQMEERTQTRYETGKAEGYISALQEFQRGYELEEIVHEDDPVRVLGRLEAEGWMKVLWPSWAAARVNAAELERLRETQAQLQMQGVAADASAAQFPLLTAKMPPKDVAGLKKLFPRRGFVAEIDALETEGKRFAAELGSKQAATPSGAWRMILSAPPQVVLWVAYTTRSLALQQKFKSFYTEWPTARQRIPYPMMQEMRIVPEVPGYNELVERLFFELMDNPLVTPEEMKAFLEPHSPPAPPPPVNLRRGRSGKPPRATRAKKRIGEANPDEAGPDEGAVLAGDLAAEGQENVDGAPQEHPSGDEAAPAERRPVGAARSARAAAPAKAAAPQKTTAKAAAADGGLRPEPSGKAAESKARSGIAKGGPVKSTGAKTAPAAAKAAPVAAKQPAARPQPKKALPVKAVGSTAPAKKVAGKSAVVGPRPVPAGKVVAKSVAKNAVKTAAKAAAKHSAAGSKQTTKPAGKAEKKAATKNASHAPTHAANKSRGNGGSKAAPAKVAKKPVPASKSPNKTTPSNGARKPEPAKPARKAAPAKAVKKTASAKRSARR